MMMWHCISMVDHRKDRIMFENVSRRGFLSLLTGAASVSALAACSSTESGVASDAAAPEP